MSFHDAYYQLGSGGRGVSNVFIGAPRMRGHGLGSWFSGIFRRALPFISKGVRAVGKEALRAGANILDDVGQNHIPFKESLKNRVNESGRNLKRKAGEKISKLMTGSGYKALPMKKRAQSRRSIVTRRIGPGGSGARLSKKKSRSKLRKRRSNKRTRKTKNSVKKPVKRLKNKKKKKKKNRKSINKRKNIKALDIFD